MTLVVLDKKELLEIMDSEAHQGQQELRDNLVNPEHLDNVDSLVGLERPVNVEAQVRLASLGQLVNEEIQEPLAAPEI